MTASDKCTNQTKKDLLCRGHPHKPFAVCAKPEIGSLTVCGTKRAFAPAARTATLGVEPVTGAPKTIVFDRVRYVIFYHFQQLQEVFCSELGFSKVRFFTFSEPL
jgi:hypothetical protein